MKKLLLLSSFLFVLFILVGCGKEKKVVGRYIATFTYDSNPNLTYEDTVNITELKATQITINSSLLIRKAKKVNGFIPGLNFSSTPIYVEGEWSNKLIGNDFKIKGTFKDEQIGEGVINTYTGTFEIQKQL